MPRHVYLHRVRANHCTSRYRPFTDSYQPGPAGLRYSPGEVCTSVARGTLTAAVRSGQCACCGGRSDRRGYGGVARMQPSTVPRREYPDRCKWEQSRLGRFAKLRLAGEETGDNESGSDSSHAEEFRFGVGYKRDGRRIRNGGCVLSPLASGDSGGMSR